MYSMYVCIYAIYHSLSVWVRVAGNASDSTNDALYSILVAIFAIFILEMSLLCALQPGYFMVHKFLRMYVWWLGMVTTGNLCRGSSF